MPTDYDLVMRTLARSTVASRLIRPFIRVRGFDEAEVRKIERNLGLSLPLAYRAFLKTMGRSTPALFGDVTMSFEDVEDLIALQSSARSSSFGSENPTGFSSNAFVFDTYLDSQFGFFACDDGDNDPMTFNYEAGNPELDAPRSVARFSALVRLRLNS